MKRASFGLKMVTMASTNAPISEPNTIRGLSMLAVAAGSPGSGLSTGVSVTRVQPHQAPTSSTANITSDAEATPPMVMLRPVLTIGPVEAWAVANAASGAAAVAWALRHSSPGLCRWVVAVPPSEDVVVQDRVAGHVHLVRGEVPRL